MRTATASRIRYAILSAREWYEPQRLTKHQARFYEVYGHPKAWLLDGRLENCAHERESVKAIKRTLHRNSSST